MIGSLAGLAALAQSVAHYPLTHGGNISANGILKIKTSTVSVFAGTGVKTMQALGSLRNEKNMLAVALSVNFQKTLSLFCFLSKWVCARAATKSLVIITT